MGKTKPTFGEQLITSMEQAVKIARGELEPGRVTRQEVPLRDSIRLLDVVALTADVPDSGLVRGQVGTVVEVLSEDTFEVEFVDDAGLTYALCPIVAASLMVLHYEPSRVA